MVESCSSFFNRLRAPGEDKFFVIVTKDAVTYHVDLLKNKFSKWEMVDSAPDWAKKIGSRLVEAINRNTGADNGNF